MEEKKWWKEGVVYQIYPRSFYDSNNDGIGDINGIRAKLEYIKALGANIIWLCPIYKSPNDDNGYDISDYDDVMDEFGTLDQVDAMIKEAHNLDLRIIMDLVVNHTSDEHRWFLESKTSKTNDKADFYIWKDPKADGSAPNNWGACFGGSAWEYVKERDQYYLHSFSKKQPDLNWENERVRDEIFSMMTRWGKRGIDGFRMDVITMISKDQNFPEGKSLNGRFGDPSPFTNNGPRVHEFLKEMNERVISHFDWMTVGEGAGCHSDEALRYVGYDRKELSMLFTFDHINVGKKDDSNNYNNEEFKLSKFKAAITSWQEVLEGKGWNSIYLENHDQVRSVSRYGNDKEYWNCSAKMLATMLLTLKGTPYIYQGEEIGMVNYPFMSITENRDISALNDYKTMLNLGFSEEKAMEIIREMSRDNSRTPMQWDSSKNGGFSQATPWINVNPSYKSINVESQINDKESILSYYKKAIQVRSNSKLLIYGKYTVLDKDNEDIFAFKRTIDNEEAVIILNFTDKLISYKKPSGEIMLSNYENYSEKLRPYEAVVIKTK